jgi:hypothetical protein
MKMLNRSVVMVRPKQPFLDWAAQANGSGESPDRDDERIVYLIPEYDDEQEAWELLEEVYEEIFESELYGWNTDESAWPQQRDFAMFQQWFDIELNSIVEDLCGYELVDEDKFDEG